MIFLLIIYLLGMVSGCALVLVQEWWRKWKKGLRHRILNCF